MSFLSGISSMFAQPTVQAIAAGLLSGAVIGSTVVASGILAPEPEQPQFVALLACPGGGPELARVPAGQQLLITARSEDGTWLEVFIGEPGVAFAWAPAPALRAASALDALPVSECDTSMTFLPTLGPPEPTLPTDIPVTAVPATVAPSTFEPTLEPGATPTPTPRPTPTPKVTPKPSKTPTPSTLPPPPTAEVTPEPTPEPTPDNNPPTVSNITTTGYFDAGNNWYSIFRPSTNFAVCGPLPISATITATITTSDVGDSVTEAVLYYQPLGGAIYSFGMTNVSGNTWQRDIATQDAWNEGQIVYWIRALDARGNLSGGFYPSSPYILQLGTCIA